MSGSQRRRWTVAAWLVGLVLAGIGGVFAMRMSGIQSAETLPTATARRGEFLELVGCRGELVAGRSVQLAAPSTVPDLRIVWLAPANSAVKNGDVVIRFDYSTGKQQLAEKTASLEQAQAALDQAQAQARITAEQDKRDLTAARHQVERARLEASKQEIVSKLKAEESRIDLGLAEEKLRVQEAAAALHKASDEAKIASLTRARDKAKDEVDLINYRISQMEVKSPIDGVITYMMNYSQGWMNATPFKVGDRVWPGSVIAEIPDLNTLEMKGKVEEVDRGRIQVGHAVRIHVDALPEKPFPGELVRVSPMTELSWDWPPTKAFRGFARFNKIDERLRPGMNGRVDVVVNRLADAVSVPAKALFTHHGKPVVYVVSQSRWTAVEVEVLARNTDEVAVKGINGGQNVALTEPDVRGGKS
jgi:RND family efflux transporter MFP subunit